MLWLRYSLAQILYFLRSILAKGEGKKQTLHFMDMNPFHMQLLLQYMYRGEISVPQGELAPLMTSARSLQIKGLCNSTTPPMAPPQQPETDRLSEFANYLAANTQPQPLTSIMPPGDLQPLDASGLINLEPPQQPVIMKNKRKSPKNNEATTLTATKKNKRSSKKKQADSSSVTDLNKNGNENPNLPDSSLKHLGEVNDEEISPDTESVGGVTENWSDQQTIKVKGHRIPVLPKPLSAMKTTETRSYLSRLIWATNGWKRPQYGNPDTKPVWWPNELLNWAEMKKMGGKKADGLSNVNYNEIQKTILHEVFNFRMKLSLKSALKINFLKGYKYFGFDPETLCHLKTEAEHSTTVTTLDPSMILSLTPHPPEPVSLIKNNDNIPMPSSQ